jgi:Do/DeqQ family serine protease
MLRHLWLIFAQTVTLLLAVVFVVSTLKPEWLPGRTAVEMPRTAPALPRGTPGNVQGLSDAARKALPSIVHIFTRQEVRAPISPFFDDPLFRHFFGDQFGRETRRSSGLGSGVIVSPDGYVLTNYHVIERASEIEVALADGRKLNARVVGSDPESDLAILQVKAERLPAITFAEVESAQVGDIVLAIGNPFGVGQTVTMGIISALGRSHLGINTFENFIQTDAAINPGNSGGGLVDAQGNLLGINTAIYSQSGGSLGIGFAIPASSARSIMEQILRTGQVTRGWIGVEAQEVTAELAESFKLPRGTTGALIAGVLRGSPADLAGIRPGDILQGVDGKPVKDPEAMLGLIASLTPGQTVPFAIRRDDRGIEIPVRVGKRPGLRKTGD